MLEKVPLWQLQTHLLEWMGNEMIHRKKLSKVDYGEHVLRILGQLNLVRP